MENRQTATQGPSGPSNAGVADCASDPAFGGGIAGQMRDARCRAEAKNAEAVPQMVREMRQRRAELQEQLYTISGKLGAVDQLLSLFDK